MRGSGLSGMGLAHPGHASVAARTESMLTEGGPIPCRQVKVHLPARQSSMEAARATGWGRPRKMASISPLAASLRGEPMMRYLGKVVLLAGAYFVAGSLGQSLAIPPGNVTLVWPPSGIALAALLLGGDRLWPAIWLGALLVNIRTLFDPERRPSLAASLTAAAAIATV